MNLLFIPVYIGSPLEEYSAKMMEAIDREETLALVKSSISSCFALGN